MDCWCSSLRFVQLRLTPESLMHAPRPRRVLSLDRLEPREVPSVERALPAGGGCDALTGGGPDWVRGRTGGAELARTRAAGEAVTLRGSPSDDVLNVDLRAIPAASRPHVVVDGGGGRDAIQLAYAAADGRLEAGP